MNGEMGLREVRGDNKKPFLLMQLLFMQLNLIIFKLPKHLLNVSMFYFSISTLTHFSSSL